MRAIVLYLGLFPLSYGQYYVISTVAGNGQLQFQDAGTQAINARLISPRWVAADGAGNIFVSDTYFNQVFQISAAGNITVAAGTGKQGFSGDGGPATAAQFDTPSGLAVDSAGNLYIADSANARVRKVAPSGTVTTVAGNGRGGTDGDGASALSASIGGVTGLAVDSAGNLYLSQPASHVLRKVSAAGTISTIAGNGSAGFSGDGGQATAAMLFSPAGIKADSTGAVYFADSQNNRIRKITPQGVISTVAGNGVARFAGDGAPATAASMTAPQDVALDSANSLYISDNVNGRIRVVNASGVISTLAGGGASYGNGPGSQAALPGLTGLAIDNRGGVIAAVTATRQVRRVSQGSISTVAGLLPTSSAGDNVPAISTSLLDPFGAIADSAGNVYISDQTDNRIRKVAPNGVITTTAGTGLFGTGGDGGPATDALIGAPRGLAFDSQGNLFASSGSGATIRRIAPGGMITTLGGGNGGGFSGDGGLATAAQFLNPIGVAADAAGNLYIADTNNHRIRRIDAVSRNVSTFAGTGIAGFSGDNGPAVSAQLFQPRGVTLDGAGNLYIADTGNSRIRRIAPGGTITTVAGTGVSGSSGDGGAATLAQIAANGVAADAAGNLFISGGVTIRKIDAVTRTITTIAGTGSAGFSGDGGLATNAFLDSVEIPAVDASGNIFFADRRNYRVRKLAPVDIVAEGVANGGTFKAGPVAPGEIVTIFFGSKLGPASPVGLQLDSSGKVSTQLAGIRVLFDGAPAPLLFLSATQVNVVVPYGVAGRASTQVQVTFPDRPSNTITMPVAASSPGFFAITNQDGSVNSATNPAAQGSVLVMYGTGEGQTDPSGVDGNVATSVYPKPLLSVSATIGGRTATVSYAGAAPGFVSGVLQMNVQIPQGVTGTAALQVKIGDATTPAGLSVYVRP